jgi:hypothetical protein
MAIIRFRLAEKGVPVPNQGDRVVDRRGRVIGQVTSCAMDTEGYLVGMAYVDRRFAEPGEDIFVFAVSRAPSGKPLEELELGTGSRWRRRGKSWSVSPGGDSSHRRDTQSTQADTKGTKG